MKLLFSLCLFGLSLAGPLLPTSSAASPPMHSDNASPPSSEFLESALQGLTWPQFESVVRSVPKLRSKVDLYGPAGWQYVRSRYQTYGWKKSLDKFTPDEKNQLAELIRQTRTTH